MSSPEPATAIDAPLMVAVPGRPTAPMSPLAHSAVAAFFTLTLSKAASATLPCTWLETANPTCTVAPRAIVLLPTSVHAVPSADSNASIVVPFLESRTQRGAVLQDPAVWPLSGPAGGRR